MRELGEILRKRREALGIQLDELQSQTKIRKRYLTALEQGDWSVLPGDVYARGFVRSYAEVVGLDGRELLEKYVDGRVENPAISPAVDAPPSMGRERSADPGQPLSPPRTQPTPIAGGASSHPSANGPRGSASPSPSNSGRADGGARTPQNRMPTRSSTTNRRGFNFPGQAAAVVAVLAVLVGAWWYIERPSHTGSSGPTSKATAVGNENVNANQVPGASGQIGNANNTAAANSAGNETGNNAAATQQATVRVVSQSFQNDQQTYVVATTQPIVVNVTAVHGSCWLRASTDGTLVDKNDTIEEGQSRSWTANQTAVVRIGNTPGVSVTINGQTVTLPSTNAAIDLIVTKGQSQ